jgi:hypothetical protein
LVKLLLNKLSGLGQSPQLSKESTKGHGESFVHKLIDVPDREAPTSREAKGDHQIDDRVFHHLGEVHGQATPSVDLSGFFVGRVHRSPLKARQSNNQA